MLEKLLPKIKEKQVLESIEILLKATILFLQDTMVVRVTSNVDIEGERCYPVDNTCSESIFADFENGGDSGNGVICVGECLSRTLLDLWAKVYVTSTPSLVFDAIKCLLMCSQKAKTSALESGFVEILIEDIKDKLVKLKMESALNSHKGVKEILLGKLCSTLEICRNFMYNSHDVKVSLYSSHYLNEVVYHTPIFKGNLDCLIAEF